MSKRICDQSCHVHTHIARDDKGNVIELQVMRIRVAVVEAQGFELERKLLAMMSCLQFYHTPAGIGGLLAKHLYGCTR